VRREEIRAQSAKRPASAEGAQRRESIFGWASVCAELGRNVLRHYKVGRTGGGQFPPSEEGGYRMAGCDRGRRYRDAINGKFG